jgi:ABC-type uncharacterized transport system involved in gliding motility auxiliary subunit
LSLSTRSQKRLGASSLVLLLMAFVFAVVVSNQVFKGLRIDLTENRTYTLSDGTERIVRGIEEPINLYFFFSDQASKGVPNLRDYANRVREMIEEITDASRGKIHFTAIDPLPFSEEEDQAAQFGLQGAQIGITQDPVYLGLAGTNAIGDEEVIAFFQPDREASLEYDIAKLISTLSSPDRSVIGLVSGVSMDGQFDPQTQRMQQPWVVFQQAQQLFEIRDLGTAFETIPEDISLLWIVQPKNLSSATQYAIDQFVMRGGKALIFVDPVAAVDATAAEGMPQGMPPMGQSSDLSLLFDGWGIEFEAQEVVTDAQLALQINSGLGNGPTRHYAYLGLTPDRISHSDIVTMELGTINVAMPGQLRVREDSAVSLEPLISSSPASATMPASRFSFLPDPSSLQRSFVSGDEPLVIAARIVGTLPSAFPSGKPVMVPSTDDVSGTVSNDSNHIAESTDTANLIVVADVDMLSDPMWVQVQNFFGQQIANAFASNGAFVVNALENLAGSSDLIAVRSRGSYSRPFTRVDELRIDAEARFLETQQRLQQELSETERRLGELQTSREDTGSLLLTDEQQIEIDRFIDQRASIRTELRAVQRGLDKDIEDLGTYLKIINIALVPLVLTFGTMFALWQRRRRDSA